MRRVVGFWPRGLVGRVTLVLLAAVLLEFTGSTVFYEQAEIYSADDLRLTRTADRLAADRALLDATSPDHRVRIVALLSTVDLKLSWLPTAPPVEPPGEHALHRRFAGRIGPDDGFRLISSTRGKVSGALILVDGTQLRFEAPALLSRHAVTRGLLSAGVLAGCVLLAATMLVRTLSLPLRALAKVADAIGLGPPVRISERGPREVRRLASAMNAMQQRIHRLISDRTEALAAVSHDLRTPLARLRLRAGFIEDPDMQLSIEADLDEMEAMVGSVLSYLAGEGDPEPRRTVDLAALLRTLVDEASDAGQVARYIGPDHLQIRLRPLAMKRVFVNLISNALAYAGDVEISLCHEGETVKITVEDHGPGIPDAELGQVMTPFYRVEASRSRATGGLGLGLAIVQREILRENGTILLKNRDNKGLCIEIMLPNDCNKSIRKIV
jgi:signal transduction histidine kinase